MSQSLTADPNHLPLGKNVRLLSFNQDGLVALEKPAGTLSHPNARADQKKSLLRASYDYEKECYFWDDNEGQKCAWLINRLDSPTSGVILLALNAELARILKEQFATHHVSKTYFALVRKVPSRPAGTWQDTLSKDVYRAGRLVEGVVKVPAKTRYQTVTSPVGGFPVTLLKLLPVTGRTHQLRVQCSKHGHPIVGDQTYGKFSFNREIRSETGVKRLLLHSAETSLRYTWKGKVTQFRAESPLPEAFREVMRFRPGITHGKKQRK